jgi:hypothetical protein
VPFVTYSGFGGADLEGSECAGVYIAKPKTPEFVVGMVADLLKSVTTSGTHFVPNSESTPIDDH